ncbi:MULTISPECIES: hypothetical protein [unclassified Paracoccus (in: a-proteobacteria)]|uniref:hypothetical protein n=1 Tax=unclassified Paracoccus (in: a-proteobacteria) TaxID=2688777 RepID=UPI0012B22927|nr:MULTISPECIES: hypothetical protein [unclassified Paracoccus (in: a-proteobacteria)]UXU75406.1 hypothetical protein GB879_002595 [Paracoccus sp. SMMA_5]UXU81312.1 hypothetical protein GB880_002590 [Paracoccus sp. SMMA_5_TC]
MPAVPQTDPDDIAALFTRDGRYLCARWGRPVAPVIFGLADESLAVFRQATGAVLAHAGHPLTETDPEMGANMLSFFVRDWDELSGLPDFDRLTGQPGLARRLAAGSADQYRLFRFDADGAIRACITLVNMGGALAGAHPGQLAETLAVRAMLTFARDVTPSLRLAQIIRAAYDPILPAVARDPSHALRLAARLPA